MGIVVEKLQGLRKQVQGWREDGRLGDVLTVLMIVMATLLSMIGPAASGLSPSVLTVYQWAKTIGSLWIAQWAIFSLVRDGRDANIWSFAARSVERICALFFLLGSIRMFGPQIDSLIDVTLASPRTALEIVFAVLGLAAVFFATSRPTSTTSLYRIGWASAAAQFAPPRVPVPVEDIRSTSVHEAGHALIYAVLPELPDDFEVSVMTMLAPTDVFAGYVRHAAVDLKTTESVAYLRMIVYRAGICAEKEIFGERSLGGQSDNEEWMHIATRYLGGGLGNETYFKSPEEDAQVAHNRQVLKALRDEQDAELAAFFTANHELLDEFAQQLARAATMKAEQVAPYLARVTFTGRIAPMKSER
ncbi:hypothetical protein KDX16_15810 [Burkholderia vietnamiensis]|jgi:hypothetical protein|uniref:ATP-dependent zinc metalloprotease FtsH n=1 Tax=Burkholderia aenigmatica TaxID=2015348 RepID=A0A6P2M3F8_9BURK|nr:MULTISPECIES: hypothetical protein [Burkholderia]HDR9761551.1 hypothetical protein [Burkholderia cepacia ATCC 25416]MBR7917290.1 hypothetical protein [Burkholderia vietnamiensis]MBR8055195.1 hypothetical protein [Burkholderia vietnamiensis]VWB72979.1 ATP-dependent zinc metalloprotease FtsH [Burkholderia aenigmatica]HDR9791962.1 hypothetical protein [Burkholderia cepacia ATCC 25416]